MVAEAAGRFDYHIKQGLACRERRELTESAKHLHVACSLKPDSTRALYELAFTEQLRGEFEKSRAVYLLVLEIDSSAIKALVGIGQICRQQNNLTGALLYFQRAASLDPARPGLRCEVAQLLRGLGRFDEARSAFLVVLDLDPCSVNSLAGLGQLCRQKGDMADALAYLQRAVALDPARLALRCEVAQLLRGLGRLDEARAAYLAILEVDPCSINALAGIGQLCRRQGDIGAALGYLQQVLTLDPTRRELRCEVAQLLRGLRRFDEALAAYLAVLDVDPSSANALAGAGQISRQQGELSRALDYLQRAANVEPTRVGLLCEIAQVLRLLGRLDEARAANISILQTEPLNTGALAELGLIARQQGDHNASLVFLRKSLARQPENSTIQAEIAATLRLLERVDEAEEMYWKAIETDPRAAAPLRGLSHIAVGRGRPEAGIEFARAAHDLDPQNLEGMLLLCSLYRDTGKTLEALALVEQTLSATPDHTGSLIEYGLLLRSGNERAAALNAFQRAANLNHERAWIEVATEHLALGETIKARRVYETILETTPLHFDALLGTANLQMLTADYATCLETCDLLIASYPKRLAPYRQKCQALIQLDCADEAVQLVRGLEASGPMRSESVATQLEVLRTCGMRAEAFDVLDHSRDTISKNFAPWFQSVLTRIAFFDLAGAEAALEQPPAIRPIEHARVLFAKGMLADHQWRIGDAINCFDSALSIQRHDPGAHEHLARLYLLTADVDRVSHHLEFMLKQRASSLFLRGRSRNVSQSLIGQLLNELKLDAPLSTSLAALLKESPQNRIEKLCAIIRSEPGPTPPAIYLLLSLRQGGFLDGDTPNNGLLNSSKPLIPKRIMQFWDKTPPPGPVAALLRTWADLHPDYQYCRFDQSSARRYLAAHYSVAVVRAFGRASHPAQESDIFRLAYLLREGGFYVDADDRCVGHLAKITSSDALLITYQEHLASLGNNFLGCVPGEEVIEHALNLAVEALNRGDSDMIWLTTGPGLLTRAFAEVFAGQGSDWRQWLNPRKVLNRKRLVDISWSHSIMNYKNTRQGWLRKVFRSHAIPKAR